jgi:hypothetical protein
MGREDRSAALEYGLARYLLRLGGSDMGTELLAGLVERPEWPAFGVLAAEADLASR